MASFEERIAQESTTLSQVDHEPIIAEYLCRLETYKTELIQNKILNGSYITLFCPMEPTSDFLTVLDERLSQKDYECSIVKSDGNYSIITDHPSDTPARLCECYTYPETPKFHITVRMDFRYRGCCNIL